MSNLLYGLGLIAFGFLTSIVGATAQWKQIGPEVSKVRSLAEVNGFIYAVDNSGNLYRSSSAVIEWTSLGRPSSDNLVICVGSDGQDGILAGTTSGVFRLGAKGRWSGIPEVPGGNIRWIRHIAQGRILAFGDRTYLIESNDYGRTWKSIDTAGSLSSIKDIAVGAKGVLWALGTTLFRSDNDGRTWVRCTSFSNKQQMRVDKVCAKGDTIIVVGAEALQSYDGGLTWEDVSQGLQWPGEINALTIDYERIYAAHETGIVSKRWEEQEFRAIMNGFEKIIGIWTILRTTEGAVYIGTNGLGVNALTKQQAADGSDSLEWRKCSSGMRDSWMARPLILPSGSVVVGTNHNEIFCNVHGETKWSKISRGTPYEQMAWPSVSRNGRAAFLQHSDDSAFVRYTDDDGRTWTTLDMSDFRGSHGGVVVHKIDAVSVHEYDSRRIAIAIDGSIGIKTTGEGGWTMIDSAPPVITVLHYNDDRIFVGTRSYGLYKWTRSKGWRPCAPDLSGGTPIYQMVIVSSDTLLVLTNLALMRSVDNGDTWVRVPTNVGASESIIDIAILDSQRMAVVSSRSVYTTIDGGEHWIDCTTDLPFSTISGIGIDAGGNMYVTTFGEGLWTRSFNQVTSVVATDPLSVSRPRIRTATLLAPGNELSIRYEVDAPMDIQWTMTTIGGERLITMNDRSEDGNHEFLMPIGSTASGIYVLSASTQRGISSIIVPIVR